MNAKTLMMNTMSILKKVIISITYFSLCIILQYDCAALNIIKFFSKYRG